MTMAATTLPFSLSSSLSSDSPQPLFLKSHHNPSLNNNKPLSLSYTPSLSYPAHPLQQSYKLHPLYSTLPSSSSSTSSDSYVNNPLTTRSFLDDQGQAKLENLNKFQHTSQVNGGSLLVRVMGDAEVDVTVRLLAESFAESMSVPSRFVNLLAFLVKQYVRERRALLPHAAMLVGFFQREDGKGELVGTVEISFDVLGANASPPTPIAPKHSPYICNMAVAKKFRRRGIGWNLLQASEQLISSMTTSKEVYLHCRMIDTVPLNMYGKAGYTVVKTDSILTLFMFQRRKHLLCKKLPVPTP